MNLTRITIFHYWSFIKALTTGPNIDYYRAARVFAALTAALIFIYLKKN